MNSITNPVTSLKWSSIAFAVLWTGWMVWWSGDFAPANIIILTICGARRRLSLVSACAGSSAAWACCRAKLARHEVRNALSCPARTAHSRDPWRA